MKQTILYNWNLMRFIRLAAGIAITVQAIIARDGMLVVVGLLFTGMPIFNIGCCGTNGCATPVKKNSVTTKDITYEEVV